MISFVIFLLNSQVLFSIDVTKWEGPLTGPPAQENKSVVFISQSFKNKGISRLFNSFERAVQVIGWKYLSYDGEDNSQKIKKILSDLVLTNFDGIVIGGLSVSHYLPEIQKLKDSGKMIVGWHASRNPGVEAPLFLNISSYNKEVAQVAVNYLVTSTQNAGPQNVGIILFNDDRFDVANEKTQEMLAVLKNCQYCKILEVVNMNISHAPQLMGSKIDELNKKYGKKWTHSLGINDNYFNSTHFSKKRPDLINISAGDGSSDALERIRWGNSNQKASVAEPLDFQAWQIVDELNRAFAGQGPSLVVASPILITKESFNDNKLSSPSMTIVHQNVFINLWHPSSLKKFIK
ncbi:MAG: substrate-binding domain-containing protein [Halobacteriovoraceae bacterium]|nr:substrate-binding domain-containing protein [Halobacteriovoraceae bacterium]